MNGQPEKATEKENDPVQTDGNPLPRLYSKKMILIFAILFSSVFSAVLLMSNLKQMEKRRARLEVLIFAISYLILTALVLQVTGLPPNWSFIANVIGAAILNEYFWNKHIGRDTPYQKKSWVKPTLISLAIALGFFFLIFRSL